MKLCTASETISFIREFENQAADFYQSLAGQIPSQKDSFEKIANENRKFAKQIQMAYQSVITDAIEGCYAFDIERDDWVFDTEAPGGGDLGAAAAKAKALEEKIIAFYTLAAEQSGSLLADVPRTFKLVVKKRNKRLDGLNSLG